MDVEVGKNYLKRQDKVMYDGSEYTIKSLNFRNWNGFICANALLRDLKANSEIETPLRLVSEVIKNGEK